MIWYLYTCVALLVGCSTGEPSAPSAALSQDTGPVDADGDGWVVGDDCDDTDASVYPGADEVCNGVDDNCDGQINEDPLDGGVWYPDADGDGFGDPGSSVRACARPPDSSASNSDCDDSDPQVHPGADEVCGDGVDRDCDGDVADFDGDGDGWDAASCGGADCDDADPSVHPGAVEVCEDGVDNNCDGSSEPCRFTGELGLDDTDFRLLGGVDDCAGETIASAGDLNGDGALDLIVGARGHGRHPEGGSLGAVWFVQGPVTSDLDLPVDSAAVVSGMDDNEMLGEAIAGVGDVHGDGYDDVLLGSPNYAHTGAAYLIRGPVSGTLTVLAADTMLWGHGYSVCPGASVTGLGDINGDGLDDVAIGDPSAFWGDEDVGETYVIMGPVSSSEVLSRADLRFRSDVDTPRSGDVLAVGDFNGDGLRDLAFGVGKASASAVDQGGVFILLGPLDSDRSVGSADIVLQGEHSLDWAGGALAAGDLDGDGADDLVVGAAGVSTTGHRAGAAYVVTELVSARQHLLADAAGEWLGEAEWNGAGGVVSVVGDVDGDGRADALIGANGNSDRALYGGSAYLVYGPASGTVNLDEAPVRFRGEHEREAVGVVAAPGDMDGDGHADMLIGAIGFSDDAGAVFLELGWGR